MESAPNLNTSTSMTSSASAKGNQHFPLEEIERIAMRLFVSRFLGVGEWGHQ